MLNAPNAGEWSPLDPETIAVLELPLGASEGSYGDRAIRKQAIGDAIVAQLQSTWLHVLLCVAAALPLLWPAMPPLIDLGGHLGAFAVQLDAAHLHGGSASLRQWYSFHWHLIPNLGSDLLMQALGPRLGLEAALKAIVVTVVVVQTGGFLMLAKTVHGRVPPTALLALPLVYSYPFEYGFLNFTLCTALATWALALWIHLEKPGFIVRRSLIFVPITCALWVCHLAGWALFGVFAAGAEAARLRNQGLDWRNTCRRAAAPMAGLLLPCLLFAFGPQLVGPRGATQGWFDIMDKLGMFVMPLRDRWWGWDVGSALLLIGTIGWTWRSRRFSLDSGLALGAIFALAAFLVVPRHVGGTSFVDMRLMPMILAIALIAVRPRDDCPRRLVAALAVVGLGFCGARFAGNTLSLALFNKQFAQDLAALDSMPRDAQLVTLTVKPCVAQEAWRRERRTHLAGYALARRHDFANDQWSDAGGQLLRVHNAAAGPFIGDGSQVTYPPACPGRAGVFADVASVPQAVPYLWIIENGLARHFPGWTPIRLSPGSVLYARANGNDEVPAHNL